MSDFSFNLDSILNDAKNKSQLADFGKPDYVEGLQALLTTYDSCGYTEKGRKRARRRVVDLLAERLRIEDAFKKHPQILNEKISQPIYLTGLPRTGTSALLNLLANDTDSRPLKLWEGMNPSPCDNFQHGMEDPRYAFLKAWQEQQNQNNPDFNKIHHTTADTPEECIHLLNHTFQDVQFGVETMMEPYGSWFQQHNLRPSYEYYANLLRMLQWQRPGKRWLLKSPAHLWALDIISDLFPDSCIIITHRNPVDAVTSYASMMAAMLKDREYDKKQFGLVVMEYLAKKVERSLALRKTINSQRILDLQFTDFINDPIQLTQTIYDYFHLPMSKATENNIAQYAKANPMGKHGKHEYDFAEFGLSEKQILKPFEFYIEHFKVPL